MVTYTLKVERIKMETADTSTVCFKQPALRKVKYEAGQYLTLIFRINGRRYIRPYSFSSAPGIDATLNVTIKRVPGGVVSNHILDKVKVGDVVEVFQPLGDFVLSKAPQGINHKHVVLWGSGSGVTPLMSIAKFALNSGDYQHITLVYGNRNFETTIFSEQIKELQQKYADTFSVWHFHTRAFIDNTNPYVIQGRIDPKKVLQVMKHEGDLKNTVHFICGPVGLKESAKAMLTEINVPAEHIFSEDFEVTRDPKAFEDVFTQNVSLNLMGQKMVFEVAKGKSILEAGLDSMLDLSYSCQTGSCLLCKASLISGDVKTIGIANLPDGLEAGECLLCCSFPLTDNVEVSVKN